MTREVFVFTLVGAAAAATHWLVLVAAVSLLAIQPLIANVLGFAVALNVSYMGHRNLTFMVRHRPHGRTATRFLAVAVSMFGLNELLYWVLLTFTPIRYDVASVIVLGSVAFITFACSKFWAFA